VPVFRSGPDPLQCGFPRSEVRAVEARGVRRVRHGRGHRGGAACARGRLRAARALLHGVQADVRAPAVVAPAIRVVPGRTILPLGTLATRGLCSPNGRSGGGRGLDGPGVAAVHRADRARVLTLFRAVIAPAKAVAVAAVAVTTVAIAAFRRAAGGAVRPQVGRSRERDSRF